MEHHTVYSNVPYGYVKAPKLFFTGTSTVDGESDASIYCYNGTSGSIYGDYIAIANNIGSQYEAHTASSLQLFPEHYSTAISVSEQTGVVYFAGKSNGVCSVTHGSTVTIPAGYYRYRCRSSFGFKPGPQKNF